MISAASARPMSRFFAYLGLFFAGLIISVGTLWAFQRGAHDFSVFYEAWRLTWNGRAADIYHATPDRFLYAPGFAWLLAPLGVLPRDLVLAGWCFGKAAVVGWMIRALGSAFPRLQEHERLGIAAWALVLLARPFLIDFQYGQVNTFVLAAGVWALLNHFRAEGRPWTDFASWFFLAVVGVTKLFPLSLAVVPFLIIKGISPRKLKMERAGLLVGLLVMLALPLLPGGIPAAHALYIGWRDALLSKGFPLESHNQAFAAFLHHVFSGQPIHVIAWGADRSLRIGPAILSPEMIRYLSLTWTFGILGVLGGWLLSASRRSPIGWIAVLVGLLILPSHLIWKPYFAFGLPAAVVAMARWREQWPILVIIFALVNFSGFDFVGAEWGARFEAAAIFFWAHLALLVLAARFRSDTSA